MSDGQNVLHPSTFHLRRRTPGSFVLIPCPQQGRSIRCQGQLEAAAATTLIGCPRVAHIQEQPLQIWYHWKGTTPPFEIRLLDGPPAERRRRERDAGTSYIVPDFLVEMTDGSKRLLEIKPSRRLARPIVQRKLAVGQTLASQNGWSFHVVTERELLHGPLLDHMRLIKRYRQGQMDSSLLDHLAQRVPRAGIELRELCSSDSALRQNVARMHVFHLLATGRLSCDPRRRPLDNQTLIYPGGVISWDPFDSVWALSGCSTDAPSGSSAS